AGLDRGGGDDSRRRQVERNRVQNRPRQRVGAVPVQLSAMGEDGGSGRLHRHATPAHRPEPLARQHVLRGQRGSAPSRAPLRPFGPPPHEWGGVGYFPMTGEEVLVSLGLTLSLLLATSALV